MTKETGTYTHTHLLRQLVAEFSVFIVLSDGFLTEHGLSRLQASHHHLFVHEGGRGDDDGVHAVGVS